MGIVCEFYIIADSMIEEFIDKPEYADKHISKNYDILYFENDNVFSIDKAWDIAFFLLKENDFSAKKLLHHIKGEKINPDGDNLDLHYIMSQKVKKIHIILEAIKNSDLKKAYNKSKMRQEQIYNAGWLTDWNYISNHIKTIQKAFKKADASNYGIVICYS